MKEDKKFIDFSLTSPIEYMYNGEVVEGQFITLMPPTSKNITECADLKQAFFRALPKDTGDTEEVTEEDKKNSEGELNGEAIMGLIAMSNNVDLSKVLLTARELFASGIAKIDGETRVNKPMLNNMSLDDLEAMAGEYLVNFILASALKKMSQA